MSLDSVTAARCIRPPVILHMGSHKLVRSVMHSMARPALQASEAKGQSMDSPEMWQY